MKYDEATRLAMQGKIIRCCCDCVFFEKHKCILGHNKESNPRDRFFDDCSLEDIEKHDTEVKAEIIDEFVKFAYEKGIGFSFMGKIKEDGTSDIPDKLNAIKFEFVEWLKEQKE